ncbi:signal peptidase II [Rhodococcus sp. Eu-32]|uniref:signal peptidase II n=1 Tax=Rhodococcus sp. Eu-32 TaxID=1017319 RepID=UPI000DF46D02|nr:signal peptidase II [Rhodococcus sp. Eu-32]RRQ26196.1 signal peptidase II [Rhodococcus sp. Eu-32]
MKHHSAARLRLSAAALVAILVVLSLGAGSWARRILPGTPAELGPLQLRLTFNSGVAFGLGNALPLWVVAAVTGSITAGLAVYAWRAAREAGPVTMIALGSILAGAVSNVIDRLVNGAVTDYFHTGWWPTFNLPDVYITCGVAALIVTSLLTHPRAGPEPEPRSGESAAPGGGE